MISKLQKTELGKAVNDASTTCAFNHAVDASKHVNSSELKNTFKKRAVTDSEPEDALVKKTKRSNLGEGMELDSMQMFQFLVGAKPKEKKDIISEVNKWGDKQNANLKEQNKGAYERMQLGIRGENDKRAHDAKVAAAAQRHETKRTDTLAKAKVEEAEILAKAKVEEANADAGARKIEAEAAAAAEVKKAEILAKAKVDEADILAKAKVEEAKIVAAADLEFKKFELQFKEEKSEAKKNRNTESKTAPASIFNEPDREPGKMAKVAQQEFKCKTKDKVYIGQLLDKRGINENYREIDEFMQKEYFNIHYKNPETLHNPMGLYRMGLYSNIEIGPLYELAIALRQKKADEKAVAAAAATEANKSDAV